MFVRKRWYEASVWYVAYVCDQSWPSDISVAYQLFLEQYMPLLNCRNRIKVSIDKNAEEIEISDLIVIDPRFCAIKYVQPGVYRVKASRYL